jgi:exopolyphosphatase/guanosine-5'-triphosphate,3'-diphosphate pyrophosphatase
MTTPLFAAIDCGTNSTRLLISDGRTQVERHMRVTRLGAGVDRTGRLDPEAIERTLSVMGDYRRIMDRYEVAGVRIAATSASRDAANRNDFFGPATEILGAAPELISGSEEAQLSFDGATADLPPIDGRTLVVDIGGGSTEFALGTAHVEGSLSVDMGCVRMTEKFLEHDPPLPEELSNALSVVEQHLDDVSREVPGAGEADRFIGLAGTVTTVAAVELGLAEYDRDAIHHFVLTRDAAEDPGRVDVIVGGCCVLVGIFRYFGFSECVVSEADILDGLILSQLG